MNSRTYKQLWSLHQKGMGLTPIIEAIQSITLGRAEATPWLVKFCKDYANAKANEAIRDNISGDINLPLEQLRGAEDSN